jgi:hypothetical protein
MGLGDPQLYRRYRREEILSFFRRRGVLPFFDGQESAPELCDGQWVIYLDTVICFAVVSDFPHSHFSTASRFCWVAETPYQASADPNYPFLPDEVRANYKSQRTERRIWLFLRRPDWSDYLCVGRLQPSHSWGGRGGKGHADFDLSQLCPPGFERRSKEQHLLLPITSESTLRWANWLPPIPTRASVFCRSW